MILVDVNIFVDVLSGRENFENSIKIIDLVKKEKIQGSISALTVPILFFLLSKCQDPRIAKNSVEEITKGFDIVPLTIQILQKSFESELNDFEDAIQFYSAIEGKCKIIITRNKKDFEVCEGVKILTPEEFLAKRGLK